MRYLCTIYTQVNTNRLTGMEPTVGSPFASLFLRGSSPREAAARAYVRAVGRERASGLRQQGKVGKDVVAQETNPRAIAASLRKIAGRAGVHYEMDNYSDSWSIQVQPAPTSSTSPRRPRLKSRLLYRSSHFPSPN